MPETFDLSQALALAIATYRAGDAGDAAVAFATILDRMPDQPDALRLCGLSLVRFGEARRALPFLSRARRLAWADPLSHLHFGVGLAEAGQPARAAAVLRRAASLAPDNPAVWINFAGALLALDKAPAARAAARRAVAVAADSAEAHYTLGLAQMACGDPAAAATAFERAARRRAGFADALVNLGVAAYRIGHIGRAMAAMRAALAADPANRAAEANLAAFLILGGETETVIERLRAVLVRDPDNVAARLNLANALLLDGEGESVLTLLAADPPPGREGRHWLAHRATAQIRLGLWAEGHATIGAIPEPYFDAELLVLSRRIALAAHDRDEAAAEALAARVAGLVDRETPLPEHRIVAHFDLARFHDQRGRTQLAFAHWTGGHRILARFQPFSRERTDRFVEASIARFDAARFRDGPSAETGDYPDRRKDRLLPQASSPAPQVSSPAPQASSPAPQASSPGSSRGPDQHLPETDPRNEPGDDAESTVPRAGLSDVRYRSGADDLDRFHAESRDRFGAASRDRFGAASRDRFGAASRDGPASGNNGPAPIFIVGMPRSGTTLAEQILSAHRDVHGAGERAALHKLVSRLARQAEPEAAVAALAGLDGATLTREAADYLAELRALAPDARYVADKMPANALHLGFVATLLPGARIVLCRRDPRDVGLSIFQHRFFGYHPYAHDLADLGWYLGRHARLMAHWRTVLPLPPLEIDLSDWVRDFAGTLARLLAFLDLPYDPACARFHESRRRVRTASAAQVRQPINARGLGRWRRYEDELAPMIAALEASRLEMPGPRPSRG